MEKIKAPLTQELHQFLMGNGYTHMNILGASDESPKGNAKFDFVLLPLKKDDIALLQYSHDTFIEEIGSDEIMEMLAGDELMNFVVELPVVEYETFLES